MQMNKRSQTSKDDFEFWVFDMDNALEIFLTNLPISIRESLDFSPVSLNKLEAWILDNYPDPKSLTQPEQATTLDGIARYIGETFRKAIGGHWSIRLDDPKIAFYGVPILTGFEENPTPFCPLALATTTTDRRTGKFLYSILANKMNRLKIKKPQS